MALHEQDNTQANGTTYHYHLDHLGTPRELTDTDGRIVWSARYRAYGNLALADVEAIDNPLRFQGQYYDAETGLHYNLNRYYDPNAGRFIHQDPIGLRGGSNVYRYAQNPVNWIDPLGLTGKDCMSALPDPYTGVRDASAYLKDQGVPRSVSKQIIESFDVRTLQVRQAGNTEFGMRYFDGVNAQAKGRFLFETFPASRESLALDPKWKSMTKLTQFQIKPGATLLEGVAAPQGVGLPGGQIQKFVPNLNDLLSP
ncbi:RHS repeat-associated core domain-containing protein [Methylomonas montana]|nr:RHS repeat-associated core domain-containing protein [Methylomonas montana]WKJ90897.1 RHS repeat-associated core domain-containing protein [Methylomonas montana]